MKELREGDIIVLLSTLPLIIDDTVEEYIIRSIDTLFLLLFNFDDLAERLFLHSLALALQSLEMHLVKLLVCLFIP